MTLLDDRKDSTEDQPDALIEEARDVQRRRRRRWSGAMLVPVLLAVGFLVFGGGADPPVVHGKAPIALHGSLPAGITARAPDPGGGLPWGIRLVRSDGYSCLQLGRLSGNQLGMVGIDRMYHDDGQFHPFAVSGSYHASCAQNDGNGHDFMTLEVGAQPASGALSDYTPSGGCDPGSEVAHLNRIRRLIRVPASFTPAICPAGDLRFIQYGLLGPEASSITYSYNGHVITEQTAGPDGAYLVVGPATTAFCDQLPKYGSCGSNGDDNLIFGGMIDSVRYRNGQTCTADKQPGLALNEQCPKLGSVAPRGTPTTGIASPVKAYVVTGKHYCFYNNRSYSNSMPAPASDLGPDLPCNGTVPAGEIPAGGNPQGTDIVFAWTARKASSATAAYAFNITRVGPNRPGCGSGGGGLIEGRVRAGEKLTRANWQPSQCTGSFTGTVYYYPNLGPQRIRNPHILGPLRSGSGAHVVGTFHVVIR